MNQPEKPIIIGITGGSGSGKTTIAHEIANQIEANDRIVIMTQDSYYKDNTGLPMSERQKINYDHPNAFDMPLLEAQLNQLLHRKPIEMPTYDFTEHTRSDKTVHINPADIIILEGILVLFNEEIRNLMKNRHILQDYPDLSLAVIGVGVHFLTEHPNPAFIISEQGKNGADCRRLSRAVRPQQSKDFSLLNRQIKMVERYQFLISLH